VTVATRRSFFAGVGACTLFPLIPIGRESSAHSNAGNSIIADEGALPHGCIFARMDGKQSHPDNEHTAPSIDFWTFRVSEIETCTLPASVGRVIVWDDLFSPRTLSRSVKSILEFFPELYGFDPFLGRWSFHLDGFSNIRHVTRAALPATTGPIRSPRLALIDVESCGLSRIDWPDILPQLRNSYDVVIGLAHFAGQGPSHPHELCDGVLDNARTSKTLACCDFSFWTSDYLLGFGEVPDYEARTPVLTALVDDLIHILSATDFVGEAGAPKAPKFFASRLRPDCPHGNFYMKLGCDEKGTLLIDGRIVL